MVTNFNNKAKSITKAAPSKRSNLRQTICKHFNVIAPKVTTACFSKVNNAVLDRDLILE